MKRRLILYIFLFSLTCSSWAQECGTVKEIHLKSDAVDRNILGDTTSKKILVYLPPSYQFSTKRYPVIYFLTGYASEVDILFQKGLKMNDFIDDKIAENELKEFIVVAVTSKIRLNYDWQEKSPYTWGAFYTNSPVTGDWETFITKELINYMDSNFRTIPERRSRAIAGHSMGGLGAIMLGFNNPGKYGIIYAISAAIIGSNNLEESLMFASDKTILSSLNLISELSAPGSGLSDYKRVLADFIENDSLFNGNAILSLAYGSAFLGKPEINPPYFPYPYEIAEGKIVRKNHIWDQWVTKLTNHRAMLGSSSDSDTDDLKIIMEFGSKDSNTLTQGNLEFSNFLYENRIAHEFRYYQGGHGNLNPRMRQHMLPYFSDHLIFDQ